MDSNRFDSLSKNIGRRGAIAAIASVLVPLIPFGAEAKPKCRNVGHPCRGKGNICCTGLECRVTGPGSVERCAVPGQPDPVPSDPPNGGNDDGPKNGGGGKKRRKASGKRCQRNKECKSNRCQKRRCCDPGGNHCKSNNECCSGECKWVHDNMSQCVPLGN